LNQNVKKKNIIITANLQQVQEKQQKSLETDIHGTWKWKKQNQICKYKVVRLHENRIQQSLSLLQQLHDHQHQEQHLWYHQLDFIVSWHFRDHCQT
jgi:hypothetical protein